MALTYEPIATTTLGSAASSITFSSIPSTYTDLRLVLVGYEASGISDYLDLRFNSDTGTNYSRTRITGTGSSATSTRTSNDTGLNVGVTPPASNPGVTTVDIFSYAGSTNKSTLSLSAADANGSGVINAFVGLWRSTSAINTILIRINGGTNLASGFTATLYGIKAA